MVLRLAARHPQFILIDHCGMSCIQKILISKNEEYNVADMLIPFLAENFWPSGGSSCFHDGVNFGISIICVSG